MISLISLFVTLLTAVVLTGCTDEGEQAKKDWMESQRAKLVRSLKDPESAKFRDEFFGANALCGEVNAKNSMGGYTGFKRYIVTQEMIALDGEDVQAVKADEAGHDITKAADTRIAVLTAQTKAIEAANHLLSDEELKQIAFSTVWNEFCFSKAATDR